MSKQNNPTKEELLLAKKQTAHNKIKSEFNRRLSELSDWGYENDIVIDAFLKADHRGIVPYISFVYFTDEEKEQYKGWKKTQVKTDQELKKDPTIIKES